MLLKHSKGLLISSHIYNYLTMLVTAPVLSIYLRFYSPLLGLGRFFSLLMFYIVARTPWMGDQLVVMPLPTYRTTQTLNKSIQTSMSWVEFEPTVPVFERAKKLVASDRGTTMIGNCLHISVMNFRHHFTLCLFQYGCEAWLSLTEHRLKMFQNKLLITAGCQMEICRENGHATSFSIKGWEFIYQMNLL
jgi:hypothetical protein